ncbi:hypothetical protein [Parasphingopyxis sp.]|uniref:hypothetical protein n=1 Tax=Parasphingopyxis sp. TaxID=1920299 RepID=UPI003FA04C4E
MQLAGLRYIGLELWSLNAPLVQRRRKPCDMLDLTAGAVNAVPIKKPQILARLSIHRSPKGPLTRAAKTFLDVLKDARQTLQG